MAYSTGATTWQLLTFRFLLSCSILLLVDVFRRVASPATPRQRAAASLLGITAYAGQAFLYFSAIQRIGAGLSAILLYLYPALVVLAVWLIDRKAPGRLQAFSVGLAFAGTTLISLDGAGRVDVTGVACAVGASIVYTGYIMASARLLRSLDPIQAATSIFLGAAVAFVAALPLQTGPIVPADPRFWEATLALSGLCTLLPVLAMFEAIARIGVARTALLSTIEPVVAVVLGILFLDERFDFRQLAGAALVLVSIGILEGFRRPDAREA